MRVKVTEYIVHLDGERVTQWLEYSDGDIVHFVTYDAANPHCSDGLSLEEFATAEDRRLAAKFGELSP